MNIQRTSFAVAAILLFQVYSLVAQTWETAPEVIEDAGARSFGAAVVQSNNLFSIGGRPFVGIEDSTTCFSTNLNADSWAQLYAMEEQIIGQGSGIDALDRIVVFGGLDVTGGDRGGNRIYEPTDGFTDAIADRPEPAPDMGFAYCTDNVARIYSIGGGSGEDFGSAGPHSTFVARYDATLDAWQELAPLPQGRGWASAVDDGLGHILVIGGVNAGGTSRVADVLLYDLQSNQWIADVIPDLPLPLSDAAATLGADGRVYVLGGRTGPIYQGITSDAVFILDLQTNQWIAGPNLSLPRRNLASALLPAVDGGYVYAIGGENDTGGTATCERLFTASCPEVVGQVLDRVAWHGVYASMVVNASGGGVLQYQWRHDGNLISDGPKNTGGEYAGTNSPELELLPAVTEDTGHYDCIITNDCGSITTNAALLTVGNPAKIPQTAFGWSTHSLHPPGAVSSRAQGLSEDHQVGYAIYPTQWNDSLINISKPIVWSGSAASAVDMTPAESVGGAINAIDGDRAVGWFWHVYSCFPGDCAWKSAGFWNLSSNTFTERHASGADYSLINHIDGEIMAGSATYENSSGIHTTYGTVHVPPGNWPELLEASSGALAVDGETIFGYRYLQSMWHATAWSVETHEPQDLNPQGATHSLVRGAGDGQSGGYARFSGFQHAALWSGGPQSFTDLQPEGVGTGEIMDTDGGIQAGHLNIDGAFHATIWSGTADSAFDLHTLLSTEYSYSWALAVNVDQSGRISVAGFAHNTINDRDEAMMWRTRLTSDALLGDLNCDEVVNLLDVDPFILAISDAEAYEAAFPDCDINLADCNEDGAINLLDVDSFIAILGGD